MDESFTSWIEVSPGETIRFGELARLMATALHGESFAAALAEINLDNELPKLTEAGVLSPRDPLTGGPHPFPHGEALKDARLRPDEGLRAFLADRGIGLRVLPTFVLEARPQRVPAELEALPDDDRVMFTTPTGTGVGKASDLREVFRDTMARQAEGHFTLNEAAQVLADSRPGLNPMETIRRFRLAQSKGELPIHQGGSRFPLEVGETVRDFWDTVEVRELDAWLRASVGYGFPKVEGTSLPASTVRASAPQEPPPDRGRRLKRAALIAHNVRRWPTIERDLKDAAKNGLSEAARDGAAVGWWWEGSAIEWARARAKVQDVAPGLAAMTGRIHRIEG